MSHDIKRNQKRVWIDHWTKKPITDTTYKVLWVGEELVIIKSSFNDEETCERIDVFKDETIAVSKLKKEYRNKIK